MTKEPFTLVTVPLIEAVIEVRFPGDLRIEAFRGDFQRKLADDFPLLLVPQVNDGVAPTLLPYRFQNESGTHTVALAIHSLSYSSQEYPGWYSFRADFLRLWSTLHERIEPKQLARIGVRFINRFDENLREHLDLVNAPSYVAPIERDDCLFHQSSSKYSRDSSELVVSIRYSNEEGSLSIDYDAFTSNVAPESLDDWLDRLHRNVEQEFIRILTDPYTVTLALSKGDAS